MLISADSAALRAGSTADVASYGHGSSLMAITNLLTMRDIRILTFVLIVPQTVQQIVRRKQKDFVY